MAWDLDLVECVEAWVRAGLPAIGLSLHQLGEDGPARLVRALRVGGLAVSSLQGARPYDLRQPEPSAGQHAVLCHTLDLAAEVGAECVVAMTGPRGELSWEHAMGRVVDQTIAVLPELHERGLRLAIEPVQPIRQDLTFVNMAADAVEIVRRVADPSFGYVFDTYHLWWQRGIEQLARDSAHHILCVQVSDHKAVTVQALDRALPGGGVAPLGGLVRSLVEGGYAGWWELEVIAPENETAGIDVVLGAAYDAMRTLWATEMHGRSADG